MQQNIRQYQSSFSRQVRWCAIVGMLAVLLAIHAIPAFFQPVFAAGQLPSKPNYPNYATTRCLATWESGIVQGNDITFLTEVTNNCPATVGGGLTTLVAQSNCNGIGTKSDSVSSRVWSQYPGGIQDNEFGSAWGCEICVNHKAYYPPFQVSIKVTAVGQFNYHNVLWRTDSNTFTDSFNIANNGTNVPPCP